ncbi:MAG: hypothetical protein K2K22_03845 [Muribaculaceae bacterium]|nr:hypothetical protein [Muribaculaceae bacterium]
MKRSRGSACPLPSLPVNSPDRKREAPDHFLPFPSTTPTGKGKRRRGGFSPSYCEAV